jgi:hypothetical protein
VVRACACARDLTVRALTYLRDRLVELVKSQMTVNTTSGGVSGSNGCLNSLGAYAYVIGVYAH